MNAQSNPVARHSVAVIGGGQAGLSISWYLKRSGIDHVVFERSAPATPGAPSAGTRSVW